MEINHAVSFFIELISLCTLKFFWFYLIIILHEIEIKWKNWKFYQEEIWTFSCRFSWSFVCQAWSRFHFHKKGLLTHSVGLFVEPSKWRSSIVSIWDNKTLGCSDGQARSWSCYKSSNGWLLCSNIDKSFGEVSLFYEHSYSPYIINCYLGIFIPGWCMPGLEQKGDLMFLVMQIGECMY